MTIEVALVAIFLGILASLGVTLAGAFASKRFGLPGIARQVGTAQGDLIETLQGSVTELERRNTNLEARLRDQESQRRRCQAEIRTLRRFVIELYRDAGHIAPDALVHPPSYDAAEPAG